MRDKNFAIVVVNDLLPLKSAVRLASPAPRLEILNLGLIKGVLRVEYQLVFSFSHVVVELKPLLLMSSVANRISSFVDCSLGMNQWCAKLE